MKKTNKKQITQKLAKEKYGIVISQMQKLDKIKFFLLDDGNVIDSNGDVRYINYGYSFTYDELMDALNHIDELADIGADDTEKSDLAKSYNYVADFISKYAKNK